MSDSPDRFFLDTNILIYSFDGRSQAKQKRAADLIDSALITHRGVISYQVVQEFLNAATRKFSEAVPRDELRIYLERVLMPLCEVFPDSRLFSHALSISSDAGISFYDALIVSSAIVAECRVLWTEDLQDGRRIGDLEIRNPFRK